MSERLIDKVGVFDDFTGDPTNPDDLYEYFHRTGKLYTALAVGGNRPQFSRDFMGADEYQRALYFAMLSNAAATLLRHKGLENIHTMTPYELSKAVREVAINEAPARYRRQLTGRNNKLELHSLEKLLDEAYAAYLAEFGTAPGRKKLSDKAKEICKFDASKRSLKDVLTEHAVRQFLKSKK